MGPARSAFVKLPVRVLMVAGRDFAHAALSRIRQRISVSSMMAESIITCPACGTSKTETMPTNACQFFYECSGCGTLLRPKPGDCCVFCSYGTVPCPPMQESGGKKCC
jgi:hypothetical protein